MVSKLQLFTIFSFLYLILKSHLKIHVVEKPIKFIFLLFECQVKLYMLALFLTLVSSKTNSHNENPLERWIVLTICKLN
jgi:hypothetical protein